MDEANAYSPKQFAKRNGIGVTKVYELIATGRLVARKDGARTLIFKEDEAAWKSALPRLEPRAA